MFKKVEYVGFEGCPELEAKAKQLTPVLAGEIRRSCADVEVTWAPQPNAVDNSLNLTLARTLHNGVSGSVTGTLSAADLAEPWLVRSRCRAVWSDLLEDLSRQLDVRIQEPLSEPLEV